LRELEKTNNFYTDIGFTYVLRVFGGADYLYPLSIISLRFLEDDVNLEKNLNANDD